MTSSIPACLDCKHFFKFDDFLPCYKFHTFDRPDYINGRIDKIEMLAHEARDPEFNRCGPEGKNFEPREIPVEVPKTSKWEQFKNFLIDF